MSPGLNHIFAITYHSFHLIFICSEIAHTRCRQWQSSDTSVNRTAR